MERRIGRASMNAGSAFGVVASVLSVVMIFYAASELVQGNGEPLANMMTKAMLVGAFGTLVGGALYWYARFASDG